MTWAIHTGDCIEEMRKLEEASVDAVVTDPPYSLGFMGRAWDSHGDNEDAGFGYYLAGLIDGEGHFRVGAGERRCEFSMKLRDDDRWILERAKAFIRFGRINTEPRRDGSAPQAKLIVDSKDGCAALCALLMRYPLRAKKLRDFLTWAEAVDEWLSMPRGNRWHGPADRARLAELGERLRAERTYSEVPWSGNAFQDWCRRWGSEAMRVLKPGGHLLAFGGARTYHRLACGLEDAGFQVRDCIQYLYGSGFPKSLDVSKAIDKAAGAEREVVGVNKDYLRRKPNGMQTPGATAYAYSERQQETDATITAPATPEAAQWGGWGTALKPAHEPIVVARKPLMGTVAENVLEHGTGGINVGGCKVGNESTQRKRTDNDFGLVNDDGWVPTPGTNGSAQGRWPAHVVLDEAAAAELDAQTGELTSGFMAAGTEREGLGYQGGLGNRVRHNTHGDSGGASRFFYCAKTSRAERNAGLEGFEAKAVNWSNGDESPGTFQSEGTEREQRNHHPTVKPINLMRWLVRLVAPPGGTVLDPFLGSGSTGCATVLEGFDFIGIEREPEYVAIAEARIAFWAQHVGKEVEDVLQLHSKSTKAAKEHEDRGQADLFTALAVEDVISDIEGRAA